MTTTIHRLAFVVVVLTGMAARVGAQGVAPEPLPLPPSPAALERLDARAQAPREQQRIEERIRRAEEAQRRAAARQGPEYTEPFSRTVALGRTGTFELTNPSGDVVVTGGRGGDLRIDATKRVNHPDESQGRALLQAIDIQVVERSGLVEVRTVFPRGRGGWSGGVDFTITLPDSATVVLRTVSGDVRVTNVSGDLRANTVSGDVITTDTARLRSVRSVSGDVQITDAQGPELTAGTVSGNLTVRNLRADSASLESVSGAIRLTDTELTRVRLRSVSGDIEYQGRLARGGRYEFESHSGDIAVTPGRNDGFDLEATTFSGDLRSDFEMQTTRTPDTGRRGRGRGTQSLLGTVGNAGAIVTMRTFSGDVALTRVR